MSGNNISGCRHNPLVHEQSSTRRLRRACWLVCALVSLLLASGANAAELQLRDGSVIVGKVLRLVDGSDLVIDTAHMDEVTIEWDFVDRLGGTRTLIIELYDGRRLRGNLNLENGQLRIEGDSLLTVAPSAVFSIAELTTNLVEAVEAYTTLGLNLVRGNNRVTQASLGAGFSYDDSDYEVNTSATTFLNEQTQTEDTRRTSFSADYRHNYAYGWGATAFYQYESDEQQNLDRRSLLAGAIGKRVVNNRVHRLELLGGLAVNDEKFNGLAAETSDEALFGSRYRLRSTADLDAVLILFPNLEQSERYRVQFDASINIDLVADLELNLTVYDRYDSEPPQADDKRDSGVTLGLRWEY